ncbi:hypothetical protein BDA99DRAFT_561546 [Phascolomyces articulosus]|uniref:ER-bound oxygenase mpaB/mpaB'/Rubber oxygenase catalytic domain-containing protein n=1 Tax=Phascolomyces articulosus TaxID=60185 RepID=A0AAD5PE03_9FUNG|nr:hypothetical protein BDA99DRAFT_561546 [Phascolomyces articulosus]
MSTVPTLNYFPDSGIPWIKLLLEKEPTQLGIEITAGVMASLLIIYLLVVRSLRFRYINELKQKYPDPSVALHDITVAEEVLNSSARKEFPFILQTSLELALFRTYSVPTISKLLYATGEFTRNTRKRAEDTELILMEMADGYGHIEQAKRKNANLPQAEVDEQCQRQKQALKRLNEIHGKYNILNGDYLYTLSLFIVEPIKWVNRYEWRQLEQLEINAIYRLWYEIGKGMNLKDIPPTVEEMVEFHKQYSREKVRYAPTNWKIGKPTVEHLLTKFPKFMRPIFSPIVYGVLPAILEPIDVAGFGLEQPKPWVVQLISIGFYLRAFFIRYFMLPRFTPIIRTPMKPDPKTNRYKPLYNVYEPTYPDGYCIFELGPDKMKPAICPVAH